jgi:hypothetical protein
MSVPISGTTGISLVQDATITTAKIVDTSITAAKLNGAQTGSAPIYGCRAWCVFNGNTAGTNAPLAGGNVTSVTKNATGDYTINFTTALQDTNFSLSGSANVAAANKTVFTEHSTARTTSSVSVLTSQGGAGSAQSDPTLVSVAIFR